MSKTPLIIFSLISLGLLLTGVGDQPVQAQSPRPIPTILLQKTAQGQSTDFFVILQAQANLHGAQQLQGKAKAHYVYNQLWQTAQETQTPLKTQLQAQGISYRSFYSINALLVEGDRGLLLSLAARADVAALESNIPLQGLRLPEVDPAITLNRPAGQTIEPNLLHVNADDVWTMGYTGQGIVIGGQDTGYEWNHPALVKQYRGTNGSLVSHDYNWHDSIHETRHNSDCQTDSPEPCDDYQHGTHTMGIAVGDDGLDRQIGMAPDAQWIGCRNMDEGYGTPATYLECFEFFLAPYPLGGTPAQGNPDLAADVTVNSWSCPPSEGCTWQTLQKAVEVQRAAGIMTIVSAGNEGRGGCGTVQNPPGLYDAVYTIGALNNDFTDLAAFSSRGPVTIDGSNRLKPDLTAPGSNIISSLRDGRYGPASGTSMAAPHVAGAVALLWSAVPALKNEVALTETYLNISARPMTTTACGSTGWPNMLYGYGHLDIKRAVQMARLSPIKPRLYLPLIY